MILFICVVGRNMIVWSNILSSLKLQHANICGSWLWPFFSAPDVTLTANPGTENLDFGGERVPDFEGRNAQVHVTMWSFPETQTRRFLVCGLLVCGLTEVSPSALPARRARGGRGGEKSKCYIILVRLLYQYYIIIL